MSKQLKDDEIDERLIYGEYCALVNTIKFFDREQMQHRFATSKILLGSFAVIGALFFTRTAFSSFQPMLIATIIPFLGILLISIEMALDLSIKERLRLSCFVEAFQMEEEYSWLPKFHKRMVDQVRGHYHGSGHFKARFYAGCIGILGIISFLSLFFSNIMSWKSLLLSGVIYSLAFLSYFFGIYKIVDRAENLLEGIES